MFDGSALRLQSHLRGETNKSNSSLQTDNLLLLQKANIEVGVEWIWRLKNTSCARQAGFLIKPMKGAGRNAQGTIKKSKGGYGFHTFKKSPDCTQQGDPQYFLQHKPQKSHAPRVSPRREQQLLPNKPLHQLPFYPQGEPIKHMSTGVKMKGKRHDTRRRFRKGTQKKLIKGWRA